MTLDDVTVTWRQIVDVTHPGLNTHLGLNTCKHSAWSRLIYSVDMDLWKLHLLRWRPRDTWWRHCDATFNCRCNTYWLEYMQGLSKYEKHWSWSNAKKFGFLPGKGSLKKKSKGKFWPSGNTRNRSNAELHWRVYKNETTISSKDFSKVNDPTISEFMARFSAWIRVPNHRVLRCGSLTFCTSGAGAKDSEVVQSIGTSRMGLEHPRFQWPNRSSWKYEVVFRDDKHGTAALNSNFACKHPNVFLDLVFEKKLSFFREFGLFELPNAWQVVMIIDTSGTTWTSIAWPQHVRACTPPHELLAYNAVPVQPASWDRHNIPDVTKF